MLVSVYEYAHMGAGTYESQKRMLDLKEQEFQKVESYLTCIQRTNGRPSARAASAFNGQAISSALQGFPVIYLTFPGSNKNAHVLNRALTLTNCVLQRVLLTPQRLTSLK